MPEFRVKVSFLSRMSGTNRNTFIVYNVEAPNGEIAKKEAKRRAQEVGSYVMHRDTTIEEVVR